jgi:hypothetical protein
MNRAERRCEAAFRQDAAQVMRLSHHEAAHAALAWRYGFPPHRPRQMLWRVPIRRLEKILGIASQSGRTSQKATTLHGSSFSFLRAKPPSTAWGSFSVRPL